MFFVSVTKCHISSNHALFARFALSQAWCETGLRDKLSAGALIDGCCWTLSPGENRNDHGKLPIYTKKKMDSSPVEASTEILG